MARLIYDIETDDLLDGLTKVHTITALNIDTGVLYSACSQPGGLPEDYEPSGPDVTPRDFHELLEDLKEAELLIGHNVQDFDNRALQKVYKYWRPKGRVRDTLIMARLIYPEVKEADFKSRKRMAAQMQAQGLTQENHPWWLNGGHIGSHSLDAWGRRLRVGKDDYKALMKEKGLDPWAEWNHDMQRYGEQDVRVTFALWKKLMAAKYSEDAIETEHAFANLMFVQQQHGFPFDEEAAVSLYAKLSGRRRELEQAVLAAFPPWYKRSGEARPARTLNYKDPMRADFTEGARYTRVKLTEFNPDSRDHIAACFTRKYNWKPRDFTPDGKPKVDDDILGALPYPEAKLLSEYLMVAKRVAALAEGRQAWLKAVRNGRVHGRVNSLGAVTRRCTHSSPNMANVPAVGVPYGADCRALFTTLPGYTLVGADASGLELRCLAHYASLFDGGAYGKVLLEGDIHTVNQTAAGLAERAQAKTFIYAFLYGAGDQLIGAIVGKGAKAGRELKARFLEGTPAIKTLRELIGKTVEKHGNLLAIDGGALVVRHQHAALNTLLQSCGAVVMKVSLVLLDRAARAAGFRPYSPGMSPGTYDYAFVGNIHDEIQTVVTQERADEFGGLAVQAIRDAGTQLNFGCPLDGAYKTGPNWAHTH